MNRRIIRKPAALLCALALLLALLSPPGLAEDETLPLSVRIALQHQGMAVGGFVTPEVSFQSSGIDSDRMSALQQAMEAYASSSPSPLINEASYYYYYDHLDPLSREISDLLYQVAMDPVSEGNVALMMSSVDPDTDEFFLAYQSAFWSLVFDHPELFWLYNYSEADFYVEYYGPINGRYWVFFSIAEPFTDFESQMDAFNAAAKEFLSDIDRSASQYSVARQIHDKLIESVTYDYDCAANSFAFGDMAHTAYGALVANSSGTPHYAVCDGISLAYQYLLQQCGIDAMMLGGRGGPDEASAGGHAWSMLRIDGVWYETDATWDNNQISEHGLDPSQPYYDYIVEPLRDPVYREKLGHFMFLVSTDTMSHYVPDPEEWYYTSKDGMLSWPLMDECVHIRMSDDPTSPPLDKDGRISVIYLAPLAPNNYPSR